MCCTAKSSVTSWWILAMMSLFLWYRNDRYDRVLSAFVFSLGMVQLIEYGVHNSANPDQAGRALFVVLWFQCFVLSLGTYLFIRSSINNHAPTLMEEISLGISRGSLLLFSLFFFAALCFSIIPGNNFSGTPGNSGYIEWMLNEKPLFGNWAWLYLAGIFLPLFLIFSYYSCTNIRMAVLIAYSIFSVVYAALNYNSRVFSSSWCYLSLGFAFVAFFMGIIPPETDAFSL